MTIPIKATKWFKSTKVLVILAVTASVLVTATAMKILPSLRNSSSIKPLPNSAELLSNASGLKNHGSGNSDTKVTATPNVVSTTKPSTPQTVQSKPQATVPSVTPSVDTVQSQTHPTVPSAPIQSDPTRSVNSTPPYIVSAWNIARSNWTSPSDCWSAYNPCHVGNTVSLTAVISDNSPGHTGEPLHAAVCKGWMFQSSGPVLNGANPQTYVSTQNNGNSCTFSATPPSYGEITFGIDVTLVEAATNQSSLANLRFYVPFNP